MFSVFLYFFRSDLVRNSANQLGSRERHLFWFTREQTASFPVKYTIDQPRFQSNIPSNR